ncbi:hypothetical protein [Heyndrickxia oleronia]|uniref:Uncharacterized protein n=3 Tax=Bacillaceae TaxID=186817 RepID=A0AAW6SPS9_9BACI|nr:hypothetical protein [Heyndrickxia oleronia]OJH19619.1 hypothetical protein BLX88_06980 [Bacillus obstructivus]MBU5212680.1 hypothetical protein [Heyndrickxia oleronia]MCI1613844.1 hypothetical protein [Heyndrickxia oleronia]MCI1744974.1 hypothetical protein [Heyndrickxia oleronia]MCI1761810.1 hypothetical protein [Heyndrickxia oleronia]
MGNEIVLESTIEYSSVRISLNQMKDLLYKYILPLNELNIRLSDGEQIQISSETLINLLLTKLSRNQLLELIHMFQIINSRKSNIKHYLEYILHGISM